MSTNVQCTKQNVHRKGVQVNQGVPTGWKTIQ